MKETEAWRLCTPRARFCRTRTLLAAALLSCTQASPMVLPTGHLPVEAPALENSSFPLPYSCAEAARCPEGPVAASQAKPLIHDTEFLCCLLTGNLFWEGVNDLNLYELHVLVRKAIQRGV